MRTSPSHLRTRCRGFQCTENRNIANLWRLRFLKRLVLSSSLVIEYRRASSRGDRHRDPDPRYKPRRLSRSRISCERRPIASQVNADGRGGSRVKRRSGRPGRSGRSGRSACNERCRLGKPLRRVSIGAPYGVEPRTALVHVFAGTALAKNSAVPCSRVNQEARTFFHDTRGAHEIRLASD